MSELCNHQGSRHILDLISTNFKGPGKNFLILQLQDYVGILYGLHFSEDIFHLMAMTSYKAEISRETQIYWIFSEA